MCWGISHHKIPLKLVRQASQDTVLLELETNPRKKQRVWKEVAQKDKSSLKMLDAPPKPTDEILPGPIPKEIQKNWGVLCDVAPEELTDKALLAEKNNEVPNDVTSP